MNIFDGNLIRKKMHTILIVLYLFRGATNEQLRRYLYPHLDSDKNGQLANVSRYISALKKLQLVKSNSCHPYSKAEINFLSKKGIDYIHEFCRIEPEGFDNEVGFLEKGPFRSFSYDILSPPTQYIEHHLMLVDVMIDYRNLGRFRHNLHCVKEYEYPEIVGTNGYYRKAKIKPDAELVTIKGWLLAIEIDTGSERFDKLVDKFTNYRRYFDYCVEKEMDIPWRAIVFHTRRGNESLQLEDDQRWQTIIKAAVKGLSYYCWTVDVLGFNRPTLRKLMRDEKQLLTKLEVNLPPKENPVIEKKKKQEMKKHQAELRKEREIEEYNRRQKEKENRIQQRKLELQNELDQKRLEEQKKKKRLFGLF